MRTLREAAERILEQFQQTGMGPPEESGDNAVRLAVHYLMTPLTPQEAETALDGVHSVPLSDEEVNDIVEMITAPNAEIRMAVTAYRRTRDALERLVDKSFPRGASAVFKNKMGHELKGVIYGRSDINPELIGMDLDGKGNTGDRYWFPVDQVSVS